MKSSTIYSPKKKVFDALKKACKKLDLEIESEDFNTGKLTIYYGGGLLSFGNEIAVRITSNGNKSSLKISSRSAAKIQLVDWGTNKDLENDLVEEVKIILNQ